jgi:small subunit ribosomal protein S25e
MTLLCTALHQLIWVCSSFFSIEQKWSKAKAKEKLASGVLLDPENYKKLLAEVPKQRLITPSNLSEKYKLGGALARRVIRHLYEKGLIRKVTAHNAQVIYTRASAAKEDEKKEDQKEAKETKEQKAEATA